MKRKLLIASMISMLICFFCVHGYAAELEFADEEDEATATEKTVLDVLTEVANEQNFQELLFSAEGVTDELQGYSVEDKPVLLFFRTLLLWPSPDDAENTIRRIWEEEKYGVLIMTVVEEKASSESVSSFNHYTTDKSDQELAGKTERHGEVYFPRFIETTLNGSATQSFCGEQFAISYVLFIGNQNPIQPPCAVYFTDGGVFVRVCWGEPESYREYPWKDFVEYHNAAAEYRIKQSNELYGGSASGGSQSFLYFIDNIYPTLGEEVAQTTPEKPTYTWLCILGVGLLVCGGITVAFIRKRKLSISAQDE